jgi:hypothetical protein
MSYNCNFKFVRRNWEALHALSLGNTDLVVPWEPVVESWEKIKPYHPRKQNFNLMLSLKSVGYASSPSTRLALTIVKVVLTRKESVPCAGRRSLMSNTTSNLLHDHSVIYILFWSEEPLYYLYCCWIFLCVFLSTEFCALILN